MYSTQSYKSVVSNILNLNGDFDTFPNMHHIHYAHCHYESMWNPLQRSIFWVLKIGMNDDYNCISYCNDHSLVRYVVTREVLVTSDEVILCRFWAWLFFLRSANLFSDKISHWYLAHIYTSISDSTTPNINVISDVLMDIQHHNFLIFSVFDQGKMQIYKFKFSKLKQRKLWTKQQ